jgi:DNA-binding NtrC family response regulator
VNLRILVVDDEPDICEITKIMLQRGGFTVDTLSDPTQAIDRLKEEQYHLVILDLRMPVLDGTEVLKRIRRLDTDLPVIITTAHPTVDSAVASMREAASDYVEKPLRQDQLLATVHSVLEKKGLLRDPEAELHRALGRAIRDARTRQELTLKQLSRRTGLSVSLLSQIERAESWASIGSLYKIATALRVPLAQLFSGY